MRFTYCAPVCATGLGWIRASTGTVVPGPVLGIGNTPSRVNFGCDPGEWVDTWSATGISHHWALGIGDLLPELRATADLLGTDLATVAP